MDRTRKKIAFLIVVKGKYSLLKQVSKKNLIWQAIVHKMLAMGMIDNLRLASPCGKLLVWNTKLANIRTRNLGASA